MEIIKYPDNTSYVVEEKFLPVITKKINTYEDLHHLEQYVDVCNYNGHTPTIVIPNLIDAQADRRFAVNQSSGLKIVCRRLNSMKASFKIFHPHNPEVVEALMDNVEIIDNSKFINKVQEQLQFREDYILMSSDAGGFKPLMKLCDKIGWKGETFSASKFRSQYQANNKRESSTKLIQVVDKEDFEGKDILIVDDICVYGGTFKGLSKLLKARNCGKLYLAVSHMTVRQLGDDPVTNYFDKVFTTNSKFDKYYGQDDFIPKNLKIIELF